MKDLLAIYRLMRCLSTTHNQRLYLVATRMSIAVLHTTYRESAVT